MAFTRLSPHGLALSLACFMALGSDPLSREAWIAEVIPFGVVFGLLVATLRRFRFSSVAYPMMSVWMFGHTLGGHYTFANGPFNCFNELMAGRAMHGQRGRAKTLLFEAFVPEIER